MVNLLLVSHSYQLAQGTAALVRQMAPSDGVAIRVAAGIGDDHSEIGTNALEILEALQELASPDGVLVLMDLGSALLSTEMALDMLDEDLRARVRLSPAPFVEGAIAAGVQANLGATLDSVSAEALRALEAKQQQIAPAPSSAANAQQAGPKPEAAAPSASQAETAGAQTLHVRVPNPAGLHARPAALFTRTVASFDAKVRVQNLTSGKEAVAITGLISVMLLGAQQGHDLLISAEGPQAEQVISAIKDLFDHNLGE